MKKSDDLKQIKELLEIVRHKVDTMEFKRTGESASLYLIKDQQSVMNEKLDAIGQDLEDVKETLRSHTGALMSIEATLEGYADAYKVNKKNIEKLDERLITAEDQLDIHPPDQLAIQK